MTSCLLAGTDVCGPKPRDQEVFINTKRQAYLARAEIAEGTYKPVLSSSTSRCLHTLSWWMPPAVQTDSRLTIITTVTKMGL